MKRNRIYYIKLIMKVWADKFNQATEKMYMDNYIINI